ncbi:hypothetical protein PGT21_013354 [Puccinia graminis f. sp. tritici]|uniref:Uncharacterized protein n=1 Tax=Puccinia graminis f. sp. tritici TaxID=56615 RepID=A0A5B0LQJ1_PUCGR|nr:hypothetical protein PGT21_013354 [Puccinia graminis f. sp. tritici]KAA1104950.1 hypothetical protein PGTUg99_007771 [Puccinia graminis f. sp. tritici]
MDQAGLADHQARVAPSKPNLAWIQPSLGTSPIWSGSDPSHAWPSPSEGATHAKPDLTAQSLGSAKPDLGQCQGPTPARPAKSSPLGAGAGPGGARTRGTGACAQTRLQHHTSLGQSSNLFGKLPIPPLAHAKVGGVGTKPSWAEPSKSANPCRSRRDPFLMAGLLPGQPLDLMAGIVLVIKEEKLLCQWLVLFPTIK